jgi:hypothetical protein
MPFPLKFRPIRSAKNATTGCIKRSLAPVALRDHWNATTAAEILRHDALYPFSNHAGVSAGVSDCVLVLTRPCLITRRIIITIIIIVIIALYWITRHRATAPVRRSRDTSQSYQPVAVGRPSLSCGRLAPSKCGDMQNNGPFAHVKYMPVSGAISTFVPVML